MDSSLEVAALKTPESSASTDGGKELEIRFRKIFFYGAVVRHQTSIFSQVESRLEGKCCLDAGWRVCGTLSM